MIHRFTAALLLGIGNLLKHMPLPKDALRRVPFWGAVALFALFFAGLAWSFFPYVVPERLTIWQSASAPESLSIILAGAILVLPVILAYTVLAWRIFGGNRGHGSLDGTDQSARGMSKPAGARVKPSNRKAGLTVQPTSVQSPVLRAACQ